MRNSAANYQPQISCAHACAQLSMLLVNTTDEKLAGFTPEGLVRIFRVKAAEISQMLATERERRAEQGRRDCAP